MIQMFVQLETCKILAWRVKIVLLMFVASSNILSVIIYFFLSRNVPIVSYFLFNISAYRSPMVKLYCK